MSAAEPPTDKLPAAFVPAYIERPCCPGKSHGDTTLKLVTTAELIHGEAVKVYAYRRRNGWNGYEDGDPYYGPTQSLAALATEAGLA